MDVNKWGSAGHVNRYLSTIDGRPHRQEISKVLFEEIPSNVSRVLDLGTGDGRLLWVVKEKNPSAWGVGLDFSEPMLARARERFKNDNSVEILRHDLNDPLPEDRWMPFDLVISGLAIHHVNHERKKQLYTEVFGLLKSGGLFINLDHVSMSTEALHQKFLAAMGIPPEEDDPSNKLLDVHTQLTWLKQIGYKDVDCYYKWLEIALLAATKP